MNEIEEFIPAFAYVVDTDIVIHGGHARCIGEGQTQVDCDGFVEASGHHWTWQVAAASVGRSL